MTKAEKLLTCRKRRRSKSRKEIPSPSLKKKKKHLKSNVHYWTDSTYQDLVAENIDFLFLVLKRTGAQATRTKTATSGKTDIN